MTEDKIDEIFKEIEKDLVKIKTTVIDEMYKTLFTLLEDSEKHKQVLESKAVQLINTSGLCFTILFALGSLGLNKFLEGFFISNKLRILLFSVTFFAFVTFTTLLFIIGFTIKKVLKPISAYRTINIEDITNEERMKDEKEYKFFLTWHFCKVYENNFEINQKKGKFLQKAYTMFLISLGCIFLIIISLIIYISVNFNELRKGVL